jgi:hypothetical protein
MLSYECDGSVLTLTLRGTPHELQRTMVYSDIAADPRVPEAALLLVDIRRSDAIDDAADIERRARLLAERLGPKLGAACAVIVPPRLAEAAALFQSMAPQLGLRIGLFRDEPEARQWLATFNRVPPA